MRRKEQVMVNSSRNSKNESMQDTDTENRGMVGNFRLGEWRKVMGKVILKRTGLRG